MKVAVGLRRVAAGKRTSGRRAAQIAMLCPTVLSVGHFWVLFKVFSEIHL